MESEKTNKTLSESSPSRDRNAESLSQYTKTLLSEVGGRF